MPTYDYVCQSCSHEFEEMQHMSASPLITCPSCHKGDLKRKFAAGIGLKFAGEQQSSPANKPSGSCCPCGKNSCSS